MDIFDPWHAIIKNPTTVWISGFHRIFISDDPLYVKDYLHFKFKKIPYFLFSLYNQFAGSEKT
ncbi:MAG: hypothetical protein A2V65_05620 [Deltaproteobacteria bacterium RBG_13_49_15]|nr:MAG: hypothetical protein A2V65_05620 [Deltaproteobacteria bacterium RBG_13_49_15]